MDTIIKPDPNNDNLRMLFVTGRGYVAFKRNELGLRTEYVQTEAKASRMTDGDARSWARTFERAA